MKINKILKIIYWITIIFFLLFAYPRLFESALIRFGGLHNLESVVWTKFIYLLRILISIGTVLVLSILVFKGLRITYKYFARELKDINRKLTFKQIIAREGLIILSWIFGSIILASSLGSLLNCLFKNDKIEFSSLISGISFFSYLIYWLIRFIIWAIRTLKEEK